MKNDEKLKITEDLSVRQTEYLKNTVFDTIIEKINDESDYEDMRCTWNLFISKMQSEAIIEALNSWEGFIIWEGFIMISDKD